MILGPGGAIIGTTQPNIRAEEGPKNTLVQLGPDGELQRTLAEFPAYGASPGQMLHPLVLGEIAFCARPENSLFYGFSLEYLIHVVDVAGRRLFAFSKAEAEPGDQRRGGAT
ncbi:MAG: hypothetical protein MZV65_53310 [Chromatiales bacterium]|nr:hypothetical protein [Chromatiales bacterium]